MKNEEEDEIEEMPRIGPGEILAFGNLNISLILNLDSNDLLKYKTDWDEITSLKNLKFIRKHHHFWKRIEITSNNSTLNILLNINKTSSKLIYVGYVVYKKINFKNEQIEFEQFLYGVFRKKGIVLTSCDICDCSINVQLILKYNTNEKAFSLVEESKGGKKSEIKNKKVFEEDQLSKDINDNDNDKENKDDKKSENDDKKEDNKGENNGKSKEDEEISDYENNPFVKIAKNNINPGDFNYIYFNFNDYMTGEFKGKIKLENIFEYFQDLKIRTRIKIILNFEDEIEIFRNKNKEEIFKDLLSITDFLIFYNMDKLYEVLKELKEVEDQEVIDESYRIQCFKIQKKNIDRKKNKEKEEIWAKNYKNLIEQYKTDKNKVHPKSLKNYLNNKIQTKNFYITQDGGINNTESYDVNDIINNTENNNQENVENTNTSIIQNNQLKTEISHDYNNFKDLINHKSKSETFKYAKLLSIKPSGPKPLNKNEMFNYFKSGIFNRDPQKKPYEKIILVLDEFNKIYIVKCNKFYKKPIVMDFDLKLYPQMTIRNMDEIANYKQFIKSKFNEYITIFIATLLGVLTSKNEENYQDGTLFISYLIAINIIKKISEVERLGLPLPKKKEFYYPSLNKEEINKLLLEVEKKKKEKNFILDGNDKKIKKLKLYNPLLDKNLSSYLNSKSNRNILQLNGLIGKNGKIIYDPTYRDTLGFNTLRNRNKNFLFNSDTNRKQSSDDTFKSLNNETNKLMVGFKKKTPSYSIYNTKKNFHIKKVILPVIKKNKKPKIKNEFNNKEKIIVEKSEESGSVGDNADDDKSEIKNEGNKDE